MRILNHAGHRDVGPGAGLATLILSGGSWRIDEIGTLGLSVRREFNVVIELDRIIDKEYVSVFFPSPLVVFTPPATT